MIRILSGIIMLVLAGFWVQAQEQTAPVNYNPFLKETKKLPAKKTTALSLPFFEDFTGAGVFPDASKWTDRSVYINNTMAVNPISRGVATFDALNAQGGPYDSVDNSADSLTSQPFDLSVYAASDSIYLSFFFQPQGNGFAPETQDSLLLYFKKSNGIWTKTWSMAGGQLQPFRQIMIAVTEADYFHSNFQFRFVNKASINLNDDVWNLDYIRMAAGRNMNDTATADMATVSEPSFLLNDYTAMPYRQFTANMNAELAAQHYFDVRNGYNTQQSLVYGYTAREAETNTALYTSPVTTATIGAYAQQQFQFGMFPVNFAAAGVYDRVVLELKYFASAQGGTDPAINDTIVKQQVFDNYLAYDDGTAEKSYFLNQFTTLPAKTAIEFHLNQPDTIRGVAIYFGRQVPLPFNKFFSVVLYQDIAFNGGSDDVLFTQELLFPGYADTVNHFWVYRFDTAKALPAGSFYIGTFQPANSGSDSLYIGLDVNRSGGNHLYYNVLDAWESSSLSGALMIRPLLGQQVVGTDVPVVESQTVSWSFCPNPAKDAIRVTIPGALTAPELHILDAQGRLSLRQTVHDNESIDISNLSAGIYFVRIFAGEKAALTKKLIKQ